jgi:methionyl-tRNA formyltransferase
MNITVLCSDFMHPINPYLEKWIATATTNLNIKLVREGCGLTDGDILFLISCSEIIPKDIRDQYKVSLVLHASDLPRGRGWSPHIWELSQGSEVITVTLLEAEDKVDTGRIWKKVTVPVPKHALWSEINHLLFQAEFELINFAIKNYHNIQPQQQSAAIPPTTYLRRTKQHSQIDPYKSIAEQFDLIRMCDPNRFPAFFNFLGKRYLLKVEESNE